VSPKSLPIDEWNCRFGRIKVPVTGEAKMKKFLILAGFLTVIATPAFAQSFDPEEGTGNAEPFVYGTQEQQGIDGQASDGGAYAQAPKSIRSMQRKEDASESPADKTTEGPAALREFRD
jgi:hypothetical protein